MIGINSYCSQICWEDLAVFARNFDTAGTKMKKEEKILVTGACGQIGRELTEALREKYGRLAVLASDRLDASLVASDHSPYITLDVLDRDSLGKLIRQEGITQIYHLAAMLSATGEKNPPLAWQVNMQGLLNVLDLAVQEKIGKVLWPSSIGVFGPLSPKLNCPQHTVTEPTTVYGISKCAGEYWCNYYFEKFGLDVRSVRYPGLISYKAAPGGGTTDYAVDIFHSAVRGEEYHCFLKEDAALPMMYMPDAIRATIGIMEAAAEKLTVRTSYNLSAFSFTPAELASAISKEVPEFKISYNPDFRQKIAESWPFSIDDSYARKDWAWAPHYDLQTMVKEMLTGIRNQQLSIAG